MTNNKETQHTTLIGIAVSVLQFIAVISRLLGPVAYTLQAVIPLNSRNTISQKCFLVAWYCVGIALFFGTRLVGRNFWVDYTQQHLSVPNKVQRLVSSSVLTALMLLLLTDICNQQQVILVCLLMCGSLQQTFSSLLRYENRVQFMHALPLIFMWIYSSGNMFLDHANDSLFSKINEEVALFVAVVPVSFLATSISHDILTRSDDEWSLWTTLECVVAHGVFLAIFTWSDVIFPKVAALRISKNLEGDVWTSSDLAIVSTMCVIFATPIARDTGSWLFENLFAQMLFAVFVLVYHWNLSKSDLFITILTLFAVQFVANVALCSKKNKV
jgi:hypothetical protein